ncbi:hypothetical protein BS78_01G002100 [Paspalum vaginatum]|nr:hypothetical protein BS78_01G002100 [Paspalum vaginatum]
MADYVVVSRPVQQAANYAAAMAMPHHHQQQQQPHDHSVVVVGPDHRPPPVRTRGPRATTQRRRQALEQEVAELKQQLSNEQTVHDILERALQQPMSVVLGTIPAFIPAKAKELLAELVLVEEEIARLENQIHTMKAHQGLLLQNTVPAAVPPPPVLSSPHHQVVPSNSNNNNAEIKSMFFISQAMDGEYLSKVKSPRRRPVVAHAAAAGGMMTSPAKMNSFSGNAFGLLPRNSLEKQHHHHHPSSLPDVAVPVQDANNNNNNRPPTNTSTKQQPQPNKLSERIVKCLVCIFIRLLRSSRVAEMAVQDNSKSSSAAAAAAGISLHLQQQQQQQQPAGMGSFRMDTALSTCLSSSSKQPQRGGGGQQDHYGIFGIPDAIVRDVGPYKNLVRFTSSSLDLRGFSTSPLLTKLRHMLEALQQVDLRQLGSHNQKLAFWLNVYNTCIMNGILQHGVPSNPDKLLALKNKATINVSGQQLNALVIENFILRQPSSVKEEFWRCDVGDVDEQAVREVYGLKTSEPNILFALCCGIRSSPALRIYKADRVAMDLDKAKLEYLQASLVVTTARRLMIPSLIHSSMHDFAKDTESLVRWICEQLPTSWSLRKSMVELCLLLSRSKRAVEEVVDVIPFDYDFQYLLPMM